MLDDGLTDGQLDGQETSSQVRVGHFPVLHAGDEASPLRTAYPQLPDVAFLKKISLYLLKKGVGIEGIDKTLEKYLSYRNCPPDVTWDPENILKDVGASINTNKCDK